MLAAAAAGPLIVVSGSAVAAPQPTIAQVKARISALTAEADKLGQQFDQAKQALQSANQRLKLVNGEVTRDRKQFQSMRSQVAQIAALSYEDGDLTSPAALLTTGNPQQILDQSSILLELSANNSDEMGRFLAAAKDLTDSQQAAKRAQAGILELRNKLGGEHKKLEGMLAQEQALLAELTPAQRTGLGPGGGTGGSGGGGGGGGYHGPTSTQADKAVQYAYDQLGCPYVWGGTGPCPDGFDCSGLVMMAWAAAGVSIPRTSYDDWAALPHVSTSDLQPGDILVFAGASHVGIYVGNNELIDAPVPGESVEKVALSGWYASELLGAVRP